MTPACPQVAATGARLLGRLRAYEQATIFQVAATQVRPGSPPRNMLHVSAAECGTLPLPVLPGDSANEMQGVLS